MSSVSDCLKWTGSLNVLPDSRPSVSRAAGKPTARDGCGPRAPCSAQLSSAQALVAMASLAQLWHQEHLCASRCCVIGRQCILTGQPALTFEAAWGLRVHPVKLAQQAAAAACRCGLMQRLSSVCQGPAQHTRTMSCLHMDAGTMQIGVRFTIRPKRAHSDVSCVRMQHGLPHQHKGQSAHNLLCCKLKVRSPPQLFAQSSTAMRTSRAPPQESTSTQCASSTCPGCCRQACNLARAKHSGT